MNHLLVDGMLRGTWWLERDGNRSAALVVQPVRDLTASERAEVALEAHATLGFVDLPAERHDVRLEPPHNQR